MYEGINWGDGMSFVFDADGFKDEIHYTVKMYPDNWFAFSFGDIDIDDEHFEGEPPVPTAQFDDKSDGDSDVDEDGDEEIYDLQDVHDMILWKVKSIPVEETEAGSTDSVG